MRGLSLQLDYGVYIPMKRMLIDTTYPEETRIAVVEDGKLEDYDFESTVKLPLKGNIYLAKVVRVEPSLQAAFVDYGANRHGFLAFNEIHPDYFKIPVADREELEALERSHQDALLHKEEKEESLSSTIAESQESIEKPSFLRVIDADEESSEKLITSEPIADDPLDIEVPHQGSRFFHKKYKIQEVIKTRQILLVQVVKEERGNKGAALTTYISLPGRYCVLMPNTLRGGGISRKITDLGVRRRLKSVLGGLDIPENMGVIVRTAGMERTKPEIKRDLDYLLKVWNDIREETLHSHAPAFVYREGDLIKRALRDFYSKDISEILVEGDEGYKKAKEFMRLLMPSHSKRIKQFKEENTSLFRKFRIEEQIEQMHNTKVPLKSGGYIVINATEALIAIDVNSGRSNKERHIEETALRTNLEAAEEIARQVRLRDLAGLIVIDFIDMNDSRHNNTVEKRLRDCMRQDRAKIQLGKISTFGLLELSRQRLRPNILEASSVPCPYCHATGLMRSKESVSLSILRAAEESAATLLSLPQPQEISIHVPSDLFSFILNQKRTLLVDIENKLHIKLNVFEDVSLVYPNYKIGNTAPPLPSEERTHKDLPKKYKKKTKPEEASSNQKPSLTEAPQDQEIAASTPSKERSRKHRRNRKRKGAPNQQDASLSPEKIKNSEDIKKIDSPYIKTYKSTENEEENISVDLPTSSHPSRKNEEPSSRKRGSRYPLRKNRFKKSDFSSSRSPSPEQPAESSPAPSQQQEHTSADKEKPASQKKGWWQKLLD